MTPSILAEIRAHAEREYPRESCGVVVVRRGRHKYIPCRNVADRNEHFVLHPEDWAAAEDAGTPAVIVHSHPNLPPAPSQADLAQCETHGLPWLIVSWPSGAVHEFAPSGYRAPLVGREFCHGVLDCYALIRDYYRETLGIDLPQYRREDGWWEKGQNLYLDLYRDCGFELAADAPRRHDVLLMQVASRVPNHGAIWLGDGCILHHQMGRLSSRDVYGGWYRKIHTHTLRHRSLLP